MPGRPSDACGCPPPGVVGTPRPGPARHVRAGRAGPVTPTAVPAGPALRLRRIVVPDDGCRRFHENVALREQVAQANEGHRHARGARGFSAGRPSRRATGGSSGASCWGSCRSTRTKSDTARHSRACDRSVRVTIPSGIDTTDTIIAPHRRHGPVGPTVRTASDPRTREARSRLTGCLERVRRRRGARPPRVVRRPVEPCWAPPPPARGRQGRAPYGTRPCPRARPAATAGR